MTQRYIIVSKRQSLSQNHEGLSGESQTLVGARQCGDWKIFAFVALFFNLKNY